MTRRLLDIIYKYMLKLLFSLNMWTLHLYA